MEHLQNRKEDSVQIESIINTITSIISMDCGGGRCGTS